MFRLMSAIIRCMQPQVENTGDKSQIVIFVRYLNYARTWKRIHINQHQEDGLIQKKLSAEI
jgi:hypothetical protein